MLKAIFKFPEQEMYQISDAGRALKYECSAELKKAWRMPAFLVPTIVTPVGFYAVYLLLTQSSSSGIYSLATFGVFATIGPALLGFGASVAMERESGILEQKRISPLPPLIYLIAKFVASATVSAAALALIFIVSLGAGVRPTLNQAFLLAVIQISTVFPTAAIGFGIGMRVGARGAGAIANLVYFLLSLLGGLWFPATLIPKNFSYAEWLTPTFNISQVALAIVGQPFVGSVYLHAFVYGLLSVVTLVFALTGWTKSHV